MNSIINLFVVEVIYNYDRKCRKKYWHLKHNTNGAYKLIVIWHILRKSKKRVILGVSFVIIGMMPIGGSYTPLKMNVARRPRLVGARGRIKKVTSTVYFAPSQELGG